MSTKTGDDTDTVGIEEFLRQVWRTWSQTTGSRALNFCPLEGGTAGLRPERLRHGPRFQPAGRLKDQVALADQQRVGSTSAIRIESTMDAARRLPPLERFRYIPRRPPSARWQAGRRVRRETPAVADRHVSAGPASEREACWRETGCRACQREHCVADLGYLV